MFLELCQVYTESINKGDVPSINSAWVSLCQNENLRFFNSAEKEFASSLSTLLLSVKDIMTFKNQAKEFM